MRNRQKACARLISEYVGSAVIVSFGPDALYYTGIGNLFSQPEFHNYQHTVNVSSLFDRCEQVIEQVYDHVGEQATIMIGDEHPFGSVCSLVGAPLQIDFDLRFLAGVFDGVIDQVSEDQFQVNLSRS